MTTARTRIVQNTIELPGPDAPYRPSGGSVSIDLSVPAAFTDGGTVEKLGRRYADVDATGFWSRELEVNADLDPPSTYYTIREARGVIWRVFVEPGDGPVWLRDCIPVDLTNGDPQFGLGIDGGSAAAVFAPDQFILDAGAAA